MKKILVVLGGLILISGIVLFVFAQTSTSKIASNSILIQQLIDILKVLIQQLIVLQNKTKLMPQNQIIKQTQNIQETCWLKTIGGPFSDSAYSIQQTSDGGYIVAGKGGSFSTEVSEAEMYDRFLIVKLDSSGNCGNCSWIKSVNPKITTPPLKITSISPQNTSPSLIITTPSLRIKSPSLRTTTYCSSNM